jgi:hypothetical protein
VQCGTDSVQKWYEHIGKAMITSFTNKANSINFNYKLCNNLVAQLHCVKGLGILLDCKLYSHSLVDNTFTQVLKMLGLIHFIFFFSYQ